MFDKLLKKNLISSLYYKVLLLILNFIFISLFIKVAGVKEYGEYVVLLSLINFGLIFNAGINNAFIKYIGENRQDNNKSQLIYSSLIILSFIYVIGVSFGFVIFYKNILEFIGLESISILKLVFIIFIFMLMFFNSNFSALLNAYERIYISNRAEGILNFSKLILSMIFLYFYGIVGALFGLLFAFLISIGYQVAQIKKYTYINLFSLKEFNIDEVKKMINFSFFTSGNVLIWRIFTSLDKVLISKFLGQETVGYYNIATSIAIRIWEVSSLFSHISYPKFLALKADSMSQEKFLKKLHLLNSGLILIIVVILFLFSKIIISLWIDENTACHSYFILNIMLIGVFFGSSNFINSLILFTYDKHKIVFFNTLISFILYLGYIFLNNNIRLESFAYGFSIYFVFSSILNWIFVIGLLKKLEYKVLDG